MNWKMLRVASVAALAVLALAVLLIARPMRQTIGVKAYFTDAMGLRPSARVRLAGVDVGSVTSVRVRPEWFHLRQPVFWAKLSWKLIATRRQDHRFDPEEPLRHSRYQV